MMFIHQGIYLPDGEKHFPEHMDANREIVDGRGTYQIRKWRACIPWIKNWRTAVDVGAHVGFWSIQMSTRFECVQAFEPMGVFRECWCENMMAVDGATRHHPFVGIMNECALGAAPGRVRLDYNPADSGNTHVVGDGAIALHTLDSFDFQNVDFIKIDCEGYEHHVVEGARETILRCKPCIIVEQKQHKMAQNYPGLSGTPAVDLLLKMGAKQRAVLSGDHILSFD